MHSPSCPNASRQPIRARLRTCRLALLLFFVHCCLSVDLHGQPLPEPIRALEAAGNLLEARRQYDALQTPLAIDTGTSHGALIAQTAEMLAVADALSAAGLTARAVTALQAFAGRLENVRDVGLAIAVHRRLQQLQERSPAETLRDEAVEHSARTTLLRADAYLRRGDFTKAKDAYESVAKQQDSVSSRTIADARRGADSAAQAVFANDTAGFIATQVLVFRDALLALRGLFVPVIAVALIVWTLVRFFRSAYLTETQTLELTDLTAVVLSTAADRALAEALQDVIHGIRVTGAADAQIDVTAVGDVHNRIGDDLPPPALVFVTAPMKSPGFAAGLTDFVASTPTVSVGGIAISPQELWRSLHRLFSRRARYMFSGTLSTHSDTFTLRVLREDRKTRTIREWRASAPASAPVEARRACLVDIACQLILDSRAANVVTTDAGSMKAYVLGLHALAPADAAAKARACQHFATAVRRDESNWLARFQLAVCCRDLNDAPTARRHLQWFSAPQNQAHASLSAYKESHPEFEYILKYQIASTLSVESGRHEAKHVTELLNELVALEQRTVHCNAVTLGDGMGPGSTAHPPRPSTDASLRLAMLARSGLSTRLGVKASLAKGRGAGTDVIKRVLREITLHDAWFTKHDDALRAAAPAEHPLAHGVVLHAVGRVRYLLGDSDGAIKHLTTAAALMPLYADVRVDLAKVHLNVKSASQWPQVVVALLDSALALDAHNAEAKFVYARLYFAKATRDYQKAEPYLRAAPFDPTSLLMLAQSLLDRAAYSEALDALERSLALEKTASGYRISLYAEALLHLLQLPVDAATHSAAHVAALRKERALATLRTYHDRFDERERLGRDYRSTVKVYVQICALLAVAPGDVYRVSESAELTPTAD